MESTLTNRTSEDTDPTTDFTNAIVVFSVQDVPKERGKELRDSTVWVETHHNYTRPTFHVVLQYQSSNVTHNAKGSYVA